MRRALVAADAVALLIAFAAAQAFSNPPPHAAVGGWAALILFTATLPAWLLLAALQGLYQRDEHADHSTIDELVGVFQMVTVGVWGLTLLAWITVAGPLEIGFLFALWVFGVVLVGTCRALARTFARRSEAFTERTLILGAGDVGQLIARKIRLHPEYGFHLVGFLDSDPRARRSDINGVEVHGGLGRLADVARDLDVDRVIVAFSREPDEATMQTLRVMRDRSVMIDVVPRLFDLTGPNASMHTIEGLPLVNVSPLRLSRLSLLIKRTFDLAGASVLLIFTSPIFAYAAIRIRLDSRGPIFFRQTRLGMDMKPFTMLKFRSMYVDTNEDEHREFVQSLGSSSVSVGETGLYKLTRDDAVTPFGRWLRRTSLDELPQLINVIRGEMSLVGPRPSIPYEIENFSPHHLERFCVPPGITGLWQVVARANSTHLEALDMDVAYVRGWSVGLDIKLALKTPFALFKQRTS
jgi:exopolysaccharide biosynthesis polyprenyl glycosylphosphotransferase